jgi:hypothetical protein
MFTPPPSPLPMQRDLNRVEVEDDKRVEDILEDLDLDSLQDDVAQRKAAIGRRAKWAVVLVPVFFVLATLLFRIVIHSTHEPWPPLDAWRRPSHSINYRRQQSGSATTTLPPQTQQTIPPVPSSSPILPTPFPAPLTTANDFTTQGCQAFFRNMTQSESFLACRPFSLLMQFSSTFVNVSRIPASEFGI